jgi:hypothetical protein
MKSEEEDVVGAAEMKESGREGELDVAESKDVGGRRELAIGDVAGLKLMNEKEEARARTGKKGKDGQDGQYSAS